MANQVGALIKEARKAAGLSQAALAKEVGISTKVLSAAERGEQDLTQKQLKAIAKATGVTQKSLLDAAKGSPAAKEAAPKKPDITDEELLELFKSADAAAQNAAISVLKGEASQNANPMAAMMGMFSGMMGGGNAESGENPMAGMMSMMGGGGNAEGDEGGANPMAAMMSMFSGMMGGGNAEGGENPMAGMMSMMGGANPEGEDAK